MSPTTLQLLACILIGTATALLTAVAYFLAAPVAAAATTPVSMRRAEMRARAARKHPLFRVVLPWLQAIGDLLDRLGFEPLRAYVRVPYARAGYPGGLQDGEVVAVGLLAGIGVAAFLGFSVMVLLDASFLWLALFGLPAGFLVLVTWLGGRAQVREIEILRGLPYMIDLMVLMLRSGTSLRIALSRVIEDYQDHPIGVEFGQVLAEIDLGAPRSEAFRKLAERLQIQDVSAFVDVIVQSEELGWPLAETLERLGDRLGAERILRAQATAGAAGVMVMIPSTLVLASAVLLLFAPFIVRFLRHGTGLG